MASPAAADPRRRLPSVDRVTRALNDIPLPLPLLTQIVRDTLAIGRAADPAPGEAQIVAAVRAAALAIARQRITPVINATGILVHTNLGRTPLGPAVAQRLAEVARSYASLEFDLETGDRGSRGTYAERLLAQLCHAAAALVVNNCAAALHLVLSCLVADRREVLIARDQLVQIGGGFRIPDILEASGATLVEVGTTNQTTLDDYRRALSPNTGLILRVHHSNFFMDGFVSSPALRGLATLAREAGIPLIEDLGSGAAPDTRTLNAADARPEPTPADTLRNGAHLVCFSGDKLFSGPQAGIIAGDAALVARLKQHPLFRALRCDKLILAALETTAEAHLSLPQSLPLVRMINTPLADLQVRARRLLASIAPHASLVCTVGNGEARMGGGALPRQTLPSITLQLSHAHHAPDALARHLRLGTPPVVGYVNKNRLHLDLRTVQPDEDETLAQALKALATTLGASCP
jgi:L-seryl-tRNA(Ser) seleniumtransferase